MVTGPVGPDFVDIDAATDPAIEVYWLEVHAEPDIAGSIGCFAAKIGSDGLPATVFYWIIVQEGTCVTVGVQVW